MIISIHNPKRVAVIGAGAAGLAAARALREVGLVPVIYEETADIGGLWAYGEDRIGPAYRSLRTNTSKQVTAFSDVPFPRDAATYPSWQVVEEYLRGYAKAFDLLPMIRFGCRVHALAPMGDGRWRLSVGEEWGKVDEVFDAVLVCSGIFRQPIIPLVLRWERFVGEILHSIDYRGPEAFAGKDVLVVGLGSSAVDIATDLAGVAGRVTLSARRGAWVAPRVVAGRPLDHRGTRLATLLPVSLQAGRRRRLLLQEYARRGLETPAELWRRANVPFEPRSAPSVTSDDLLPRVMSGEIGLRPGVERFEGREMLFADGSYRCPDAVIFATGYRLDFPFLPPELIPWSAAGGLYRLVFLPDHPTLAFIGVCRVHGPILPIVEMQARWAARVLVDAALLPSAGTMRAEIGRRWRRQIARRDSPFRVSLLPYLDEIGGLIGVQPRLWRRPRLLRSLLLGPPVAAQYRLDGPNCWVGAADLVVERG